MPDRPFRLLVIEDETPIRHFLRVVLEGAGFVMDEAGRGREGIERAAAGVADVVVLDLGLPDIDGKEVIRAIREWSQVPIPGDFGAQRRNRDHRRAGCRRR